MSLCSNKTVTVTLQLFHLQAGAHTPAFYTHGGIRQTFLDSDKQRKKSCKYSSALPEVTPLGSCSGPGWSRARAKVFMSYGQLGRSCPVQESQWLDRFAHRCIGPYVVQRARQDDSPGKGVCWQASPHESDSEDPCDGRTENNFLKLSSDLYTHAMTCAHCIPYTRKHSYSCTYRHTLIHTRVHTHTFSLNFFYYYFFNRS